MKMITIVVGSWIFISMFFTLFLWKGIADMNGEPDYDDDIESQV